MTEAPLLVKMQVTFDYLSVKAKLPECQRAARGTPNDTGGNERSARSRGYPGMSEAGLKLLFLRAISELFGSCLVVVLEFQGGVVW